MSIYHKRSQRHHPIGSTLNPIKPPSWLPSSGIGKTIAVTVGEDSAASLPKTYLIHRAIFGRSPFYRALLASSSVDIEELTVQIPNLEPGLFHLYRDWAYWPGESAGDLTRTICEPYWRTSPGGRARFLVKAWKLGEFLQDRSFQNACLGSLVPRSDEETFTVDEMVEAITKTCEPASELCRWVVEFVGALPSAELLELKMEEWDSGIVAGTFKAHVRFANPKLDTTRS